MGFPKNHTIGALRLVKNPLVVPPTKSLLDSNRDGPLSKSIKNKVTLIDKAAKGVAKQLDKGACKKLLPLCTPPTFNPPIQNGSPMRELYIQLKNMWMDIDKMTNEDNFEIRYKKCLLGYISKQKLFTGLPQSKEALYIICFGEN